MCVSVNLICRRTTESQIFTKQLCIFKQTIEIRLNKNVLSYY